MRVSKLRETDDSSTDRIDLYRGLKASGRVSEADDEPLFPIADAELIQVFFELHSNRTSGGFAVNPITFESIKAYGELMRREFTPWEVSMIRRMDDVMLKAGRITSKNQMEAGKQQAKGQARG